MKMMILWTRTSMLTNQNLQTPRVCNFQLDTLQCMILRQLACCIFDKYDGKRSARCAQFTMENMTNNISWKLVMCQYAGIVGAH